MLQIMTNVLLTLVLMVEHVWMGWTYTRVFVLRDGVEADVKIVS